MRFKKGSKIEVFSKSEVPSGAWRPADMISGNGHNYTVRYVHCLGRKNETVMERVSRKAIRPCPPPVNCKESLVTGDLVEVFDDFSWKIASILKVLSAEYYLIRLLGSSKEFQAHKVNIRVRQSWQDGEWIMIGKVNFLDFVLSNFFHPLSFFPFWYIYFQCSVKFSECFLWIFFGSYLSHFSLMIFSVELQI